MTKQLTESQAIAKAKLQLKDGFTFSLMNANQAEDFIWGYLYDNNLQYNKPIEYVDEFGNNKVSIVYQQL